jgi:hypothetical protein
MPIRRCPQCHVPVNGDMPRLATTGEPLRSLPVSNRELRGRLSESWRLKVECPACGYVGHLDTYTAGEPAA